MARRKGYYRGCGTIILPGSNWFGRSEPIKWRKPKSKKKMPQSPRPASAATLRFEAEEAWKAEMAAESEARKAERSRRSAAKVKAAADRIAKRTNAKMAGVTVERKRLPPKLPKTHD